MHLCHSPPWGQLIGPSAAQRAFEAMMQMKNIDIAAIETARRG
jgi:hypothetical protein